MEKASEKISEKELSLAESKTKEMNNELTSDGTCPQCIQINQDEDIFYSKSFFSSEKKN